MTVKSLKDGGGSSFNADLNLLLGEQADADSKSVVLSTGSKALLTSIATLLTAIGNNTDGLEGFVDGVEGLITSSNTKLDSLATLITALNGYVDQLEGYQDGLEAALGVPGDAAWTSGSGSHTALLKAIAGLLATQNGYSDQVEGYLSTLATAAASAAASNVTLGTEKMSLVDGTQLTPKFAAIAASASGSNTLVAAVTGKKIRVLAYNFMFAGTANAKFVNGAAGSDLTGLKYGVANAGICAAFNPVGWFETSANTLLSLNLSAAVAVGGELVYLEV